MYRAGIVTLSDKGAAGEREDKSGAVIKEILESAGYEVVSRSLLPDEGEALKTELIRLSDQVQCDLVLTTGGTGFSSRESLEYVLDTLPHGLDILSGRGGECARK